MEKYNKASGTAKDKLAQEIRNLQSKALYFAQEAYHTEGAIKHVVMSIQAADRKITPETLLSEGPLDLKYPITPAEARQSYAEQIANMLKGINKYGDPADLSAKGAKYFIRALDGAKNAGIDLTPFKDMVEITYELDANRKDIQKVRELLMKKYGAANLDQFLKDVRKTNRELTALVFGGPIDFSVATGVGKTGDFAVIALPEALKRFAAKAPVELVEALEGKGQTGMDSKEPFVDPDVETKDNLPRVETEMPGDKGSDPNLETKFAPIEPSGKTDKGPTTKEARDMVKNFEERVARENAALLKALGLDVIYADARYRHLLENTRTEREERSLAITGNLRDMMTAGEKALADKAYDIAESLRSSNPDLANLNTFEILRYVHFHSDRVSPSEAPLGSGARVLDAKSIPASLAAEALLAQGKDVWISPEQLTEVTGISIQEARMAVKNAIAWRNRGGPIKPTAQKPGETTSERGPPPDGPTPPTDPSKSSEAKKVPSRETSKPPMIGRAGQAADQLGARAARRFEGAVGTRVAEQEAARAIERTEFGPAARAAEAVEILAGMKRINEIRETVKYSGGGKIKKGSNVAYADYEIAKDRGKVIGVSGKKSPVGTAPEPKNRIFSTREVGHPRAFDSEVKILEDIANRYQNNPNVSGKIYLFSERPFCPSCKGVVEQFEAMFPNIKVFRKSGS